MFQSLTGRLKTDFDIVEYPAEARFQSLTGRLKTASGLVKEVILVGVSIPHR